MKLKNIFIISGILTLLMQIFPIILASLIPSVKEFFIIDGFGESMLQNTEGLVVVDTFLSVMGFMGAAIAVPIFGALRIKDLNAKKRIISPFWNNAFSSCHARLYWSCFR